MSTSSSRLSSVSGNLTPAYPIFLATVQSVFTTATTRLLAHHTTYVDLRKTIDFSSRVYMQTIIPIAMLLTASIALSSYTDLVFFGSSVNEMIKVLSDNIL